MVRGTYAPIRDLTFRGTYSKATRAPNITEAFLPATPGFTLSGFDPVIPERIDPKVTPSPSRAASSSNR